MKSRNGQEKTECVGRLFILTLYQMCHYITHSTLDSVNNNPDEILCKYNIYHVGTIP